MHNSRRPLPPLNALRIFEAAARHASFKAAAEETCITQSAVSRQIKVLEEFYGIPLFNRKVRKVEVTEEGQRLYLAASSALEQIAGASHEIFSRQNRGYLSVASTTTFSSLWLLPRLHQLKRDHPDVQLHLVTTECSPNLNDSFDVAITLGYQETEGFESTLLFTEEMFPVCAPEFLEKHPELKDMEGLKSVPLLSLSREHWKYKIWPPVGWDTWFNAFDITFQRKNVDMTFNHFPLVIDAVKRGMGVGLAWRHLVDSYLKEGSLVQLFAQTHKEPQRGHFLVIREENLRFSEIQTFKQWMLEQTRELRQQ